MTETATVTSKGQITIPKQVREAMGVRSGDLLVFQTREKRVVELRPARSFSRIKGMIKPWISHKTKPPSLKDIDEAVLNGSSRMNP